jgi:hypothetical protein
MDHRTTGGTSGLSRTPRSRYLSAEVLGASRSLWTGFFLTQKRSWELRLGVMSRPLRTAGWESSCASSATPGPRWVRITTVEHGRERSPAVAQFVNEARNLGLDVEDASVSRVIQALPQGDGFRAALAALYANTKRGRRVPSDLYSDEGVIYRIWNYRHQVTHRRRQPSSSMWASALRSTSVQVSVVVGASSDIDETRIRRRWPRLVLQPWIVTLLVRGGLGMAEPAGT